MEDHADSMPDELVGLALLAAHAGRLPERVKNCSYESVSGKWVTSKCVKDLEDEQKKTLMPKYMFQVEKARSGASACKFCGEKIGKSLLRVGYPTKDHRGDYGAIEVWLHVGCARAAGASREADKTKEAKGTTTGKNLECLIEFARKGPTVMKEKAIGFTSLAEDEQALFISSLIAPQDEEDASKSLPPALLEPRKLAPHPAPASLTVKMFPFQSEALGWLIERERDQTTRGGILADEMGMGKTLQMIALILAGIERGDVRGPTLVVCPAAAMLQWRNEILRFSEKDKIVVDLYYGFERKAMRIDSGSSNRLVLTTYQTLESDYRHAVNKHKVKCEWCGRLFLPEKIKYHQKYWCGPDAERTEGQQKQERNEELKTDAVKRMKIGGVETEISLDPLQALRGSAMRMAARRRLAQKSAQDSLGEQKHVRMLPFPASVLPEEARVAAGISQASSSGAPSPAADDAALLTPQGRSQARSMLDSSTKQTPCTSPSPGATSFDETSPASQLRPPSRKRWANSMLQSPMAAVATGTSSSSSKPRTSFGLALNSTKALKSISLDDSGSDIELMNATTSTTTPVKRKEATLDSCDKKGKEADAADSIPPRPDSDDDMEFGAGGRLDLSESPLFKTCWARIILDEAHRIKGRTNSTAQATFALRASTSRWCLSGTPIQNRVAEFYAVIRFIRFYPYAHYMCSKKGCNCASLHYRFDADTSKCNECGHTKMQHRSHFTATVTNPIMKFGFLGAGKTAMEKLRTEVLDKIMLRRTKLERQADIHLPSMTVSIRKDKLSDEERDFYKSMYTQSLTKFGTYVDKGTLLHNYAHVFDLIMRLRQAVDHPYLIVHGSMQTKQEIPTQSRGDSHICALCQDDITERLSLVIAQCGHAFHRECATEYIEQAPQRPELPTGGVGCPSCYAPLTLSLEESDAADLQGEPPVENAADAVNGLAPKRKGIMQRVKTSEFKSSTKIEALLQEIQKMSSADQNSKALVFSQFTSFLELIEWRLKCEGISCAKLMGSLPIQARNNIILTFQTNPSLKVLLISLKAGGEGLNLQAADTIFLMDPWWNPAAELQAIQRAHRIGQKRPVKAIRFVAEDTIEDKIIELQQKKQSVFDCTVGGSNAALQRLTAEDIQFLFSA